jgi:hypothetical protein
MQEAEASAPKNGMLGSWVAIVWGQSPPPPSAEDYNRAKEIADEALENAKNSSLPGKHNGLADAYRHCLWSCKMSYELGGFEAWTFATGHELFDNHLAPYNESQMDFANNCSGRDLGSDGSPFTCEVKCMNAAKNGDLITSPPKGAGIGY